MANKVSKVSYDAVLKKTVMRLIPPPCQTMVGQSSRRVIEIGESFSLFGKGERRIIQFIWKGRKENHSVYLDGEKGEREGKDESEKGLGGIGSICSIVLDL